MNRIRFAQTILLVCTVLFATTFVMAQAGSLDPTFGTGGIATTPNTTTGCGAEVNCAVAIQSDGKIIVAGGATAGNGAPELALARYNSDGSLDPTFGSGGLVVVGENNGGPALGVAIQSDGKIVTAAPTALNLGVFRFNPNGTLDNTFGTGGIVSTRVGTILVGPTPGGLAVLSNGNIMIAVGASLVRFLPTGQLDATFGSGGIAPLVTSALGLSFLPSSGKSLVTSSFAFTSGSATRYNANGSLDAAFGVAGQLASVGEPLAIAPLSTGKFIVAGTIDSAAPHGKGTPQAFVLTRYNANGTIDGSFGIHGSAVTNFPGNAYSAALALAVQVNGDIIAAGTTAVNNPVNGGEPTDFALARYTPSGQLDTTFGHNGLVTTALGTNGVNTASISALAIQSDGKIVAVGNNAPPNFNDPKPGFTLARYLAD